MLRNLTALLLSVKTLFSIPFLSGIPGRRDCSHLSTPQVKKAALYLYLVFNPAVNSAASPTATERLLQGVQTTYEWQNHKERCRVKECKNWLNIDDFINTKKRPTSRWYWMNTSTSQRSETMTNGQVHWGFWQRPQKPVTRRRRFRDTM